MSDWTPLTQQEIYQKSLDEAQGEPLVPETRLEYFLNKIAEGSGGTGGDSDFTTATMTIATSGLHLCFPCIDESVPEQEAIFAYSDDIANDPLAEGDYIIPLYKGLCGIIAVHYSAVTLTGDAEFDNGLILVTGDFTITGASTS